MTTGDSTRHAARRSVLPGDWRPAWSTGRPGRGRPGRGRPAFRAWRRGRPFSGGLLLALAGIELLAIPLSGVLSHGAIKLVVYIGIGGVFGVLIGVLLITAGIAVWVNPAHRVFYGVTGVVLGIGSFPASNLGGFFLCMLLAIVGGSLAFAWVPGEGPAPGTVPGAAAPSAAAPRTGPGGEPTPPYGNRMLAVALPLMLAAGLATAQAAAGSAPASPRQTCILGIICAGSGGSSPSPSVTVTPTCLPTALPTALPAALPTALPTNLPKCLPTALPTPSLPVTVPAPSLPVAVPTVGAVPGTSSSGSPAPGAKPPTGKGKAKSSTAGAGLVAPAAISVITADSVSMAHFTYQGNVKMPTASGGTVTMMKFTASSLTLSGHVADAVTEAGVTAVTSSPVMAFNGNVVLYATRLSGSLANVPLTFTPDTISGVLLRVSNLLTSNVPVTMTSVTTDQATGTADSLVYGPGGGGFSVLLR